MVLSQKRIQHTHQLLRHRPESYRFDMLGLDMS